MALGPVRLCVYSSMYLPFQCLAVSSFSLSSSGMLVLKELGMDVSLYVASEIDPDAINVLLNLSIIEVWK